MIFMTKKACIISIYGNNNFGNKLQNYAIQKKCSCNGLEAIILKNSHIKCNKIKRFLGEHILKRWYRNKNFWYFEKKFLKKSKNYAYFNSNNKELNTQYDYFIVGSDQVWNPHFGLKGDLEFLEFVNNKPTIAFSASFGVDSITENLREDYTRGLNNIDYISVREDAGKKIVEDLTNRKDVQVLIDPTMLLTKEDWQHISKKPNNLNKEKYILNYFLGNLSDERKNKINKLANKHGWKVINILDKNDPYYNSGPSEFVYLEEHAELICTDSFHSCVFGILMDTPFIVFEREDKEESMNSRIVTLLSKFKLDDRKYNGDLNDSHLKYDYSSCYKILETERKKSESFLKKALKNNN